MNAYDTAKTKAEQQAALLDLMYESARQKVDFWLSLGKSATEAIGLAKRESCAGLAVWARIEAEAK